MVEASSCSFSGAESNPSTATRLESVKARQRAYFLSVGSSLVAKVVNLFISFATIPITLAYLGVERFGIWMTISSLVGLLAFADLGIGNGLVNLVANANARADHVALRRHVSNATFALSVVSLGLFASFLIAYKLIDWVELFGIGSTEAAREIAPAVAVLGIFICLNVPATIAQRVQMGLQMGYVADGWQVVGSVFALALLIGGIRLGVGLPGLVACLLGGPLCANLLNLCRMWRLRPEIRPQLRHISVTGARHIVATGTLFLVLQLTAAVGFSADTLIIARFLGPEQVAGFAIGAKLFSAVGMAAAIALKPLWPAFGDARARGDTDWIKQTANRAVCIAGGMSLVAVIVLASFADDLTARWSNKEILLGAPLIGLFCLWTVTQSIGLAYSMLLNGLHIIKLQVVVGLTFAALSIGFKVAFIEVIGAQWILIVNIVLYVGVALLPYIVFFNRQVSR